MEDFLTLDDYSEIYNETGLTMDEVNELLSSPRVFQLDVEF